MAIRTIMLHVLAGAHAERNQAATQPGNPAGMKTRIRHFFPAIRNFTKNIFDSKHGFQIKYENQQGKR